MRSKFTWMITLCLALAMQFSFAQEKTITGTVTDQDGLPLPGVNIVVKGTSTGTQSDFDGNYSIKASTGQVLVFTYLGQKTVERSVGASSAISVQMEEDAESLEEVVVTAYGTIKKTSVTAAQTTVKAKTIEQVPIPALDQVLQGQVAGLSIGAGSGAPGVANTAIILRGRSSFNPASNLEPLFVIDGVPVSEDDFSNLNSNDIESLTVLKDASASALYGNRGSNGVIVITTRKGSFNQPLRVSYRTQFGVSSVTPPQIDFLNTGEFLTYQRTLGAGAGANLTDAEIDFFAQTNTDWSEILLRRGKTQSHEITLSGGGEKLRNYTSLSYFEQEGTTARSKLQRLSLRSNVDYKGDRLTFSSNITLNFARTDATVNAAAGGGSLSNPFIGAFISLPYLSPFNPDGSLNLDGLSVDPITGNPTTPTGFLNTPYIIQNVAEFDTQQDDDIRAIVNLNGTYKLVKNLTVGTNLGIDYTQVNELDIVSPLSLRGLTDVPNGTATVARGSRRDVTNRQLRVNFINNITYKNTFNDKHDVEFGGYMEYFKQQFRNSGFTGFGLDPRLIESIGGLTAGLTAEPDGTQPFIPALEGATFDLGLFSVFGLARYTYDDKYSFEANFRRDASSRFEGDNEFGNFFSVSGRWNLYKEEWLNDVSWIDNLALRAGYGEVGNQDIGFAQANVFATGDTFTTGVGIAGSLGLSRFSLGNPDLRWETKQSINIGVDFGFFNSRLTGSLDVYQEDTEDILLPAPIAPSASGGFTTINQNLGELRNEGVELALSYDIIRNKDINWNVYGNISFNRNEVLVIDGELDFLDRAGLINDLSIGDPFGSFFDVEFAGVNPANGRPLFFDIDGNVTETFSLDNRVLFDDKTRDPEFQGGFGMNFSWKGFGVTTLFSYATNVWRDNGTLAVLEDPSLVGIVNQSRRVLDAWQAPGDITTIPAPQFFNRFADGTRFLENASYLRLRNITVGYTFNAEQLKNTFQSVRFYVLAQNLFTITRWQGFDPEDSNANSFFDFPVPRTITVGFDVNF